VRPAPVEGAVDDVLLVAAAADGVDVPADQEPAVRHGPGQVSGRQGVQQAGSAVPADLPGGGGAAEEDDDAPGQLADPGGAEDVRISPGCLTPAWASPA